MNAFEAAEKNGRAGDLQMDLEVLFNSQNKAQARMSRPLLRPSYVSLSRLIRRCFYLRLAGGEIKA
jgi:hypothetical protein